MNNRINDFRRREENGERLQYYVRQIFNLKRIINTVIPIIKLIYKKD